MINNLHKKHKKHSFKNLKFNLKKVAIINQKIDTRHEIIKV